jgi:hypothetical protein
MQRGSIKNFADYERYFTYFNERNSGVVTSAEHAQIALAASRDVQARAEAEYSLKAKTAADEAQRAADGEPSADAKAVTAESVAAAKVAPGEDLKKAAQDILDHQQFFKAAEAAGVLDDDAKVALQDGAAAIDNDAKSMTNAALQAAACIARGLI